MVSILGYSAAAWGLIMAISPALQIRRMMLTRSSEDVSVGYLTVLLPGFVLWVAYGVASDDVPLVVPNVVALCVGTLTVGYALRLRR
jgi:MtN3 and saliva related transmembrane protein